MKLTAVFQKASEGGYIAFVEELPGANTQGETLDEARENLREAGVQRHALFFQCDGRIEHFARRGHRGWMIAADFARRKARRRGVLRSE